MALKPPLRETVRPRSWAGNHIDNDRPSYISPKRSLIGQSNLQPRDAKVSNDSGLLDLATFLRENPSPTFVNPKTAKIESGKSNTRSPPQSRFVNRVLRVGTRRSGGRVNLRDQTKTETLSQPTTAGSVGRQIDHQRQMSSATRIRTTPGRETGSDDAAQEFPTWFQQKENAVASPFDEATGRRPDQVLTFESSAGDDTRGLFAVWLESEIMKQRRRRSPRGSLHLPDGPHSDFRAPQPAKNATNGSRTLQTGSPKRSTRTRTSNTVIPHGQRSTNIGSHPLGPISPPPQKPLPPSPPARSSSSIYSHHIITNSRAKKESTAELIFENYHAGLTKRRPVVRPFKTKDRRIATGISISGEESITNPAKSNMEVESPVKFLDSDSGDAKETAVPSPEAEQAESKSPERKSAYKEPATTPISTGPSCSSTPTRDLQRKIREDRTRARKIKHLLNDSQSTTETQPQLTDPLMLSESTDFSSDSTPGNAAASQEASSPPNNEDNTTLSESALFANEQTRAALIKPDSIPSSTRPKLKPPNLNLKAATYTLTKSISAPSLVATSTTAPPTISFDDNTNMKSSTAKHSASTQEAPPPQSSPFLLPAIAFNPQAQKQKAQPTLMRAMSTALPSKPTAEVYTPITDSSTPQRYADKSDSGPSPQREGEHTTNSRPTPHKQQLRNRISHLERENRLLEAALMAVLKTGGALNRCPCPCYCSEAGASEAGGAECVGGTSTALSELQLSVQSQVQAQPDSGVVMPATSLGGAQPQSGRKKSESQARWIAATSTSMSTSAGSEAASSMGGKGAKRGVERGALALYMQTRRASGFGVAGAGVVGVSMDAIANANANAAAMDKKS